MTVWTSDISKAGTDANVFIQMYGTEGKTDEIVLNNRSDNFERGMKEKFKASIHEIFDWLIIANMFWNLLSLLQGRYWYSKEDSFRVIEIHFSMIYYILSTYSHLLIFISKRHHKKLSYFYGFKILNYKSPIFKTGHQNLIFYCL